MFYMADETKLNRSVNIRLDDATYTELERRARPAGHKKLSSYIRHVIERGLQIESGRLHDASILREREGSAYSSQGAAKHMPADLPDRLERVERNLEKLTELLANPRAPNKQKRKGA